MPAGARRPLSWSLSPLGARHCGDTDTGGRSHKLGPVWAAETRSRRRGAKRGRAGGAGSRDRRGGRDPTGSRHGTAAPAQWHQPAAMPGQPVSPGCSDRGDPVPGCGGQSTPGSPHPLSLQCPTCRSGMWGVWGNARRSLCPHRGWDWGWQTGLRSSAARHRAISQHVPAWDMVVSPLLLQKSRFLAPKDTNVPVSPLLPRTPLAPVSPSALGGAEGGCARNWASPAPH